MPRCQPIITKNPARFPTYLKTNLLKTSTKPTCKNGSTRISAPLDRSSTASMYLQQVSEAPTSIGLGGIKWKYKKWRSYRDGWSPHMLANQAQYHFLLKIQLHLLGQHGYTKWSPPRIIPNIWPHTFTWEEAIHRAFCGDKDPEAVNRYIATISYGPTYYRNLTAAQPTNS